MLRSAHHRPSHMEQVLSGKFLAISVSDKVKEEGKRHGAEHKLTNSSNTSNAPRNDGLWLLWQWRDSKLGIFTDTIAKNVRGWKAAS